MVHVEVKDLYNKEYTLLWSILSFKAGLLNAAGFLLAGSYVSHVTGFGTQIGLAFGLQNFTFGLELLIIPIGFISGALITSLILDSKYNKLEVPNYPIVQFMITFLLGIICLGFEFKIFTTHPILDQSKNTIYLIGLLCFICGLKNALTTWATHGKVRTTHLTGLSTDIGLHLQKLFKPEGSNSRYPEPRKVTYVRIATLISFSIGSCISAILIQQVGYKIFYISFSISVLLLAISILHRNQIKYGQQTLIKGVYSANTN